MRLRFPVVLVALAVALIVAPVGFAQTVGTIVGVVKDSSGGALPGVSVEAKSSALQGTKTVVTSADGSFRIPLLPPGEYTVSFNLSGFTKVDKKAAVQLAKTATVDVSMALSTKTEEIVVTGEAPVVDSTNSSSGANFTSEFARTLPLGRNFTAVATKVPGVIAGFGADNANFNVYGSTGAENNFIVDGVDTTEIRFGRSGKAVSQEFVAETEVKAGGFQAEYGHSQGGVVNAITKSGGNEFHGSVFGYYQGRPDSATGSNLFQAEDKHVQIKADSLGTFRSQADFIRNTRTWDAGVGVGGFFVKDFLWFYGGYDKVRTDRNDYLNNPTANCSGGPGCGALSGAVLPRNTQQDLFNAKLTIRATDWLSLVGSVIGDPRVDDPNLATPVSGADPGTYAGALKLGGTDYSGRIQGTVGTVGLFELQAARHNEQNVPSPLDTGSKLFVPTIPAGLPRTGGFGRYDTQTFNRNNFRGAATYFASFLGSHEFKAGGDYSDVRNEVSQQYTGPSGSRETLFVRNLFDPTTHAPIVIFQHEYNSTGVRENPANVNSAPIESDANFAVTRSNNYGAFIQDKWQPIPSLTLNVGIRYEDQKVKGNNGNTEIHVANEVMPRVGFAWDFSGNGKSRIFGNYARFYQTMPTDINVRAYGLEVTTAVYNTSTSDHNGDPSLCGTRRWATTATGAGNTTVCSISGGIGRAASIKTGGSFGEPTQPGIKGQYSDEFSLGAEFEPITNLAVSAKWIYRNLGRVIEDGGVVNSSGDLEYFIFNPGTTFNSPVTGELTAENYTSAPPKRYYKALSFAAQKRFNNKLQFIASYTWSRLEGNYDGVFQTSTTQLDPNINSAYDYRVFLDNAYGDLSNDRRHTLKLDGSYITPFGLAVGLSAYYFTGTPITQRGYYNDYRNYELYLTQRGTAGRTPDVYEADLHLGYEIPLGPTNIMIGADVFNLLNVQRTLQVDERQDLSEGGCSTELSTAPTTAGSCTANGGTLQAGPANPNYLQAIAFTGRRQLRLTARVSF